MKKITLSTLLVIASFCCAFSQPVLFNEAPPFDNSTTQVRAPNGLNTSGYMRACALVLSTELTNIPSGSTLTSFGFTLTAGASSSVSGNFTLHLQNTSDVTYNKGLTFATALTGMTSVYASTMTLPGSTTTSVTITLSTPFVYTGGGLYVAYDWYSAGPYATSPATYRANSTGLISGCASAATSSTGPAPATLGSTSFRPCFLFGINNPFTNEVSVIGLESPGRVAAMFNTPHNIRALVRNNSAGTLTNIPVSLNVTGANAFANTQTITSLAAGAITTVTFAAFNPSIGGLNTVSVSLPSDQNNANNSGTYSQSVTCNEWALNPANANYTIGSVGFNTGSGIIAVSYTNPVASSLTGIRCSISTATTSTGNALWCAVLSATGGIVATTNTITLNGSMLGTFQTFTFSSPVSLSASTLYHFGLAQPTGTVGYFPIGTFTAPYVPFTNYVTTTTVGGTPAQLTSNLGYFGMEGIFSPIAPPFVVPSPTITCGGSATLAATTSASYSWSAGPINASYIVTPTVSTTYTANTMSAAFCSGTNTVAVTVNPLAVAATGSTSICTGQSVTLTASGATSYSWSSSQNTSTISVTPGTNTTYIVTGSISAGCSNTAAITVSVVSAPVISIGNFNICSGNTLTLSPTGASTYSFSNGSATIAPTTNTTVSITGTNSSGCASSNTAICTITVNTSPTISVNDFTICSGNSVTLSPTGANTYSYSNGSSVITPNSNTVVNVTGTASNGCVSTNTAVSTILVNTTPTVSVNSGSICSGLSFTISPSGASSYTVSGGNTVVSPSSTTIYSITGLSAQGCISSNTALCNLTVNVTPTITVNSGSICTGQSFTIAPSGAFNYTIPGGNTVVSPLTNTVYNITGVSAEGCVGSNTAVCSITVETTPTIAVSSGSVCIGNTFNINPTGAVNYTITGGNSIVSPSVSSSFTVTGSSAGGCVAGNTVVSQVTVNATPTINASSNKTSICSGESATLSASGAFSYLWNNGATASDIPVSPSITTVYIVTGTGTNGCSKSFTITQNVSNCVGVNQVVSPNNAIHIFPNPNNGLVTVNLNYFADNLEIRVVNALGQTILQTNQPEQNTTLDLRNETSGVYFVYLLQGQKPVMVSKLIKQ